MNTRIVPTTIFAAALSLGVIATAAPVAEASDFPAGYCQFDVYGKEVSVLGVSQGKVKVTFKDTKTWRTGKLPKGKGVQDVTIRTTKKHPISKVRVTVNGKKCETT